MKDLFQIFLTVMAYFVLIACLSMITNPESTAQKANRIVESIANIYHGAQNAFHQECK